MFDVNILLIVIIGLVTGFFDATIGAGGLVSIPSLILLGIPPQIAIASDRFGTLLGRLVAISKYWKANTIVWKYVPILAGISLLSSLIGANILLNINSELMQTVVALLIVLLLPFLVFGSRKVITPKKVSTAYKGIGLFIYFLIMIFSGFFGQGTGPLIYYTFTHFLGFTMLQVNGTGAIPGLVLAISTTIVFAFNNLIDYKIGFILLISMAIGNYIGAHVAITKGNTWLKKVFVSFVLILAAKLLFF